MTATDTHRAIEAVFRIEQAKLIAGLTRMVRDIGLAEELAQDALVAALEQWPTSGIPDNPGAWLMAAAKHRAIDRFRRNKLRERKHEELGYELEIEQETAQPDLDAALDDRRRRRSAAPRLHRLPPGACRPRRASALTLRLLGGLTTDEIARAFLVPEPTIAAAHRARQAHAERQRRALRGAARRGARRRVCPRCCRSSISSSTRAIRRPPARTGCGRSSARRRCVSAASWPSSRREEPEVHGLVALMEIQASRSRRAHRPVGRAGAAARPGPRALGPASHPPRSRRAGAGGGLECRSRREPGPYALQAAIAACHARARTRRGHRLGANRRALRRKLGEVTPSPIVELNRAVALAMVFGPEAGSRIWSMR